MTEADWLACTDPLRMPKLFRGRSTPRKRLLLTCAYALDPDGGFRTPAARQVIETVRDAAFATVEVKGFAQVIRDAVNRLSPDLVGSRWDLWPRLSSRPEFGTQGGRLALFLGECALGTVTTGAVNSTATYGLATVRHEGRQIGRKELEAIVAAHGWRLTDAFKEEVLALIPEPDRTSARSGNWLTLLPERIRKRVYAARARPPATKVATTYAELVREVLGNPFRAPKIEPEWLVCNHGAVKHIAEQIGATGNFADMPILADALEDAGCRDDELLRHCRGEHAHASGCWALDLVLGRS